MILAFSKNWKLSLLTETQEVLSAYLKQNTFDQYPLEEIKTELKLNDWIFDKYFYGKTSFISIENLNKILEEITKEINSLL